MDVMNAALGGMMIAQSSFDRTANAQVFQAGDKMQKKLLDIMA
jgi:flagellar hook protein FlgE